MPIADLGFLEGTWEDRDEDTRMHVGAPWGDAIFGWMQYAEFGSTVYWEFLRFVESGDTLTFHPLQRDRPLGDFRLVERGDFNAVFENDDDPALRRVSFTVDMNGDRLITRVEGERDGVPYSGSTFLHRVRGAENATRFASRSRD